MSGPKDACSLASLLQHEDPVGTATPFDDLFLLQVAPPWASVALSTAAVPSGIREALVPAVRSGRRAYVLLIDADDVPAPPAGALRLMHVQRPAGPARRLVRREYAVAPDAAATVVGRLAAGRGAGPARELAAPTGRDLLVCVHGDRDACCGRFGEAAYRFLRDRHTGPDLRVWRVSHFGGHRFAPTMLDLPDGRCWGRLSEETMTAIAHRSAPPSTLAPAYRGWCALPGEIQAAERDLFVEHGWDWLEAELRADLQPGSPSSGASAGARDLEVSYRLPGGPEVRRRATLERGPAMRLPVSCGAEPSEVVHYACTWHGRPNPKFVHERAPLPS